MPRDMPEPEAPPSLDALLRQFEASGAAGNLPRRPAELAEPQGPTAMELYQQFQQQRAADQESIRQQIESALPDMDRAAKITAIANQQELVDNARKQYGLRNVSNDWIEWALSTDTPAAWEDLRRMDHSIQTDALRRDLDAAASSVRNVSFNHPPRLAWDAAKAANLPDHEHREYVKQYLREGGR